MPLRFLEPGSVGTSLAVSKAQPEDSEDSGLELKGDLIKSSFLTIFRDDRIQSPNLNLV